MSSVSDRLFCSVALRHLPVFGSSGSPVTPRSWFTSFHARQVLQVVSNINDVNECLMRQYLRNVLMLLC